jgi:hypothetical protein
LIALIELDKQLFLFTTRDRLIGAQVLDLLFDGRVRVAECLCLRIDRRRYQRYVSRDQLVLGKILETMLLMTASSSASPEHRLGKKAK